MGQQKSSDLEASTLENSDEMEHPVHGTTVYLAQTTVPTRYGVFKACIFQDIIHKGYIIALTFGDVNDAEILYTRMHSGCVTSETLCGCDCDCVQQLEGAMKKNQRVRAGGAVLSPAGGKGRRLLRQSTGPHARTGQ